MLEITEAGASIFFLDRYAVQAERPHLRPKVARENIVAVDGVGAGRDAVLCEAVHRLAQHVDVGAKPEIEARPCVGNHAPPPLARPDRRRWRLYKLFVTLSAPRPTPAWACRPAGPFPAAHRSRSPVQAWQRGSPASRRNRQAAAERVGARSRRPRQALTDQARGQAPPSPG